MRAERLEEYRPHAAHARSDAPWEAARRLLALAGFALSCGVASALVAIAADRTPGGPAESVTGLDLLALYVAASVVLLASVFGFWFALLTLWSVRLTRALPIVFAATVLAAAAGGRSGGPLLAVLAGLAAGFAAMLLCRSVARWRLPDEF